MCYAMGLPGALDQAGAALGLAQVKEASAQGLMLQMASPREVPPDGTIIWWDGPEKRAVLYRYCQQDIRSEWALYQHILRLSPDERAVWVLDQKINQRGVRVDRAAARRAAAV